ncbi:hypothetical protein [Lysobacter sp. HA35]
MLALALPVYLIAWFTGAASLAMYFAASHELRRRITAEHPELLARYRAGVGRIVDPLLLLRLALVVHREAVDRLSPNVRPVYADSTRYLRRFIVAAIVALAMRLWQPAIAGA